MKLVSIKPDTGGIHKFVATFETEGRQKRVRFGLKGYEHYTDGNGYVGHKDDERRQRYLSRHRAREDWQRPDSPGALSYWLLWKEPTWTQALRGYVRRFQLE